MRRQVHGPSHSLLTLVLWGALAQTSPGRQDETSGPAAPDSAITRLVVQRGWGDHYIDLDASGRWIVTAAGTVVNVFSVAHRALAHQRDLGVIVKDPRWIDEGGSLTFVAASHAWRYDWRIGKLQDAGEIDYDAVATTFVPRTGEVLSLVERGEGRALLRAGVEVATGLPASATAIAVNATGARVLVVCDGSELLTVDAMDGGDLRRAPLSEPSWGLPWNVSSSQLRLAPDGSAAAALVECDGSNAVVLARFEDAEAYALLVRPPPKLQIRGVAGFRSDGLRLFVDAGAQAPIELDVTTGEWVEPPEGGQVVSVTYRDFEATAEMFAVTAPGFVHTWKVGAGSFATSISGRDRAILHATVDARGQLIVEVADGAFGRRQAAIDLRAGEVRWINPAEESPPIHEPLRVFGAGADANVLTWDSSRNPIARLDVPAREFEHLPGTAGGGARRLCVSGRRVVAVDVHSGAVTLDVVLVDAPVSGHWLPRSERCVFAFASGAVEIWDEVGAVRQRRWDAVTVASRQGVVGRRHAVAELPDDRVWIATGTEWVFLDVGAPDPVARRPVRLDSVRSTEGGFLAWGFGAPIAVGRGDPATLAIADMTVLADGPLGFYWDPQTIPGTDIVVSPSTVNGLLVWRETESAAIAEVVLSESGGLLILGRDGQYLATPEALELLVAVDGEGRVQFPATFDLDRNDPATLLERIGLAEPARIEHLRAQRERRLAKSTREVAGERPRLGFAERPPLASTEVDSVRLKVRVEQGPPLARYHVEINGVPIGGAAGSALPSATTDWVLDLPLGPGENRVSIVGAAAAESESDAGVESDPLTTVIHGGEQRAPEVFLLSAGISAHPQPALRLRHAAHDVEALEEALRRRHGSGLRSVVLRDSQATRAAILERRAFLEEARFGDLIVVHLAGHGFLDARGSFAFVTADATPDGPDACLSIGDLEQLLGGLGAGRVLVLIDACHSGAGGAQSEARVEVVPLETPRGARPLDTAPTAAPYRWAFADVGVGTGATILGAASATQYAVESDRIGHGAFTHAILEALATGEPADRTGVIHVSQLVEYVRDRVVAFTGGRQVPQIHSSPFGFDLEIASAWPLSTLCVLSEAWSGGSGDVESGGRYLALFNDDEIRVVDLVEGSAESVAMPAPDTSFRVEALPGGAVFAWDGDGDAAGVWVHQPGSDWMRCDDVPRFAVLVAGATHALCFDSEASALVRLADLRVIDRSEGFLAVEWDPTEGVAWALPVGREDGVVRVGFGDAGMLVKKMPAAWAWPKFEPEITIYRYLSPGGRYLISVRARWDGAGDWMVAIQESATGAERQRWSIAAAGEVVLLTPDGPIALAPLGSMGAGLRVVSFGGDVLREAPGALSFLAGKFAPATGARFALAGSKVAMAVDLQPAFFQTRDWERFRVLDPWTGGCEGWFDVPGVSVLLLGGRDRLLVVAQGRVMAIAVPEGQRR